MLLVWKLARALTFVNLWPHAGDEGDAERQFMRLHRGGPGGARGRAKPLGSCHAVAGNACQAVHRLACLRRATSSSGTSSFAGHPRRSLRYGGCATQLQSRWHNIVACVDNTGTNTVSSSLHCVCGHTHAQPEPLQGQRGEAPPPSSPTSTAPSFHPPCHTRSLPTPLVRVVCTTAASCCRPSTPSSHPPS